MTQSQPLSKGSERSAPSPDDPFDLMPGRRPIHRLRNKPRSVLVDLENLKLFKTDEQMECAAPAPTQAQCTSWYSGFVSHTGPPGHLIDDELSTLIRTSIGGGLHSIPRDYILKKTFAPLGLAALLLLTGCGSEAPSAEAPTVDSAKPSAPPTAASSTSATAEPSPSATTAPAAEKSERGNLVKQVGQGASLLGGPAGEPTVSFVINSITVDAACTAEFATPPENGHFVILDVSVKTEPTLAESDIPQFYMSASDWKAIAPNGTTSNANAGTAASYGCLTQSESLPQTMGPAEQATGKIVLDLENPQGTLIFKAPAAMAGWEWTYPAP